MRTRNGTVCPSCGGRKSYQSSNCQACSYGPARTLTGGSRAKGYVNVRLPDGRWRREHIVAMEGFLGRPLRPGENVHHRNGNRADNRLSNLELWAHKQPHGQRVADLIAYAREILADYDGYSDPA